MAGQSADFAILIPFLAPDCSIQGFLPSQQNLYEKLSEKVEKSLILASQILLKIRRTACRCLGVSNQQAWIPSMYAFTNIQWGRFLGSGAKKFCFPFALAGHFGTRFSMFFSLRFLRSPGGTLVLQNLQKSTPNPFEIRFLHYLFFERVLNLILVRFLVAPNPKNIDFT